ncbi:MAG: VCBS repeat-containing protein [Oscillospiraceae bacterium]|nr:VCBS repeat-containing protein [Oscillospiraceae bacterium]
MRIRTLIFFVLAMQVVLMLTGCSIGMDVEALLRPPRPAGEQQKIQQALDEYINSTQQKNAPGAPGGYVLKYPNSGEYRSAFVIKDLDNDGVDEAIVFYRRGIEGSKINLNFLRKLETGWQSVCDIEGASTNIERVQFADLDSDGILEVLTGWNMDNLRDKQLVMYLVSGDRLIERHTDLYTEFIVGKLTNLSNDCVMVLHANSAENITTAKLLTTGIDSITGQTSLVELGSTRLDGYIQQFSTVQIAELGNNLRGVYADGIKDTDSLVTELVYWDGKQLCAPFYNKEKNANTTSYRKALLPSMDLDGDGTIEWPIIRNLTGYSQSDKDKIWFTRWEGFDIATNQTKEKFSCIINMTDNYSLLIDKSWEGQFTLSYDMQSHTLTLYSLVIGSENKPFLMLKAVFGTEPTQTEAGDNVLSAEDGAPELSEFETVGNVRFYAWISPEKPFSLSMERLRYMFSLLQ